MRLGFRGVVFGSLRGQGGDADAVGRGGRHVVVVEAALVRLPSDPEERLRLLDGVRVGALPRVGLGGRDMPTVSERLREDDEVTVDPLAELDGDVADRPERRAAVRARDLLHGHGPLRAPAAHPRQLVQAVRDELAADAGVVVATAGDAPLRAPDAVVGERAARAA